MVRHVGRLLDGHRGSVPFELVKEAGTWMRLPTRRWYLP